jgi:hypothetical protein
MTETHPIPTFPAAQPAACQCHEDAGRAPAETEACLCHLDAGSQPLSETEARPAREPLSGEHAGWLVAALRVALMIPVLAVGLALVVTGLAPVLFATLILLLPALAPILVVLLGIAASLEARPAKVARPASTGSPASAARLASVHSTVGV